LMNEQETAEIRELTLDEAEEVSGGIGFFIGFYDLWAKLLICG